MRRSASLMASFLTIGCLAACGGDRQQAALALDEARLAVSGARRKGAERLSARTMAAAQRELGAAESHFVAKRYARVEAHARRAVETAGAAGRQAAAASRRAPPPRSPKRRK